MYPLEILNSIEQAIEQEIPEQPEPMPGDKWLLMSAMQKAIRRGEVERAKRAAASLFYQDKVSFYRRVGITTLEDCGIACPDVLVKVLTASASSAWRRRVGELRVGLHLVTLLCGIDKTRLADALFIQAEKSPAYHTLRLRMAAASDETLAAFVRDEQNSLVGRAIAIWLLAGTQKFKSDAMPPRLGSPHKAVSILRTLDVPNELTEACIGVIGQSQWPLSVFTPLIWQEVRKYPHRVRHHMIPVAPDVNGLPHYSADMFSRIGKYCIRQWQKAVPELKPYSTQQLGLGLFYTESHLTDKQLTAPELDAIQSAGEATDFESAGLEVLRQVELKDCLAQHMDMLADIRQEQLRNHLSSIAGQK